MGSGSTGSTPVTPRTWLQRLVAFPATYGENVTEALKIAAALEQAPSIWTVRYYAFRIALLTLRRRMNSQALRQRAADDRRAAEIAQHKTIAGEIDRPGTVGIIVVATGHEIEFLMRNVFERVSSPCRLYSKTLNRAEFANGSAVMFTYQDNRYAARGRRIDWAWVAPGVTASEEWLEELRSAVRYSRTDSRFPPRLYVDGRILSNAEYEPHRRG